ncbi:MAG: flagellar assembly peptidoglycan hydrolase FlgJ [Chitinivorax sp.]
MTNRPSAAVDLSGRLSYDVQALTQLRTQARGDEKGSVKAVAQQFEAMFTSMMLKTMRNAVPQSAIGQSNETRMFQGMFDDQLSQNLASHRGLGIAALIERQMTRTDLIAPKDLPTHKSGKPLTMPVPAALQNAQQALDSAKGQKTDSATPLADFVDAVVSQARKAADAIGVAPHLLAAQAALETAWGKRKIVDASGNDSFNLFGIKAGKGWQGKVAHVATTEFENGQAVKKVQPFRVYGSYGEAMEDYARLVKDNGRYQQALNQGGDARAFAAGLQQGGYATDPNYAQKLERVANSKTLQRVAMKAYAQGI